MNPTLLITLYGLLKQAQCGDFVYGDDDVCHGSFGAWKKLQRNSWKSLRGTPQSEAMERYCNLVNEAVPN